MQKNPSAQLMAQAEKLVATMDRHPGPQVFKLKQHISHINRMVAPDNQLPSKTQHWKHVTVSKQV